MSSTSERSLPREAGPRPDEVPVVTDREHRENMRRQKAQEADEQRRFVSIVERLTKKTQVTSSKASDKKSKWFVRASWWIVRAIGTFLHFVSFVMTKLHSVLLGNPPDRVLSNKPPFRPLSIHRWAYFWFYVTPRLYKRRALHWLPIPRPSVRRRAKRSTDLIADVQFHETKVIAVFAMKGGVGKTSIAKALAGLTKRLRQAWDVLVQDNNPDRGTLADRGRRTVKHCISDLVDNLSQVESKIDFVRYCNELEEGALMLASTRPDEFSGELDITEDDFIRIHNLENQFFDVVFLDCGTDKKRETNLRGLEEADAIHLVSTPARDSLYQAVMTYVWMCKHPELRSKHIVLIINRKKWWNNLDKIQSFFVEAAKRELSEGENIVAVWRPMSFQTFSVSWDLRLALGLNFTSYQLRRTVQTDQLEVLARTFELIADSFASQPDSQLTHLEVMQRDHELSSHRQTENLTHDDVIRSINSATAHAAAVNA